MIEGMPISYLRTATHDRLVGRLKDAAQLREPLILHLEHYVRPRRAVVVEIIVVAHQFFRVADVGAKYRVGLHLLTRGGHNGNNNTCKLARKFATSVQDRGVDRERTDWYRYYRRRQTLATSGFRGKRSRVVLIVMLHKGEHRKN